MTDNKFNITDLFDEQEDTFTMKIGGTTYEVTTHFSTDGKQSVLQQFMELLKTAKI
jgi:hypothetical protein